MQTFRNYNVNYYNLDFFLHFFIIYTKVSSTNLNIYLFKISHVYYIL